MSDQPQPTAVQIPFQLLGWIGVGLDGTLAQDDPTSLPNEIGEPVAPMMRKVHKMIADGRRVKIFTARASDPEQIPAIKDWLERNGLAGLEITNVADARMVQLFDWRATFVYPNEGITHDEHMGAFQAAFLEVAQALDVRVENGMQFGAVAQACAERARACKPQADAAEKARSFVDAAIDALGYVQNARSLRDAEPDFQRALLQLNKALLCLNALAGKKEEGR